MNDKQLIEIMISLTGYRFPKVGGDIQHVCEISPPNWYAYMGLMETYSIKYTMRIKEHENLYEEAKKALKRMEERKNETIEEWVERMTKYIEEFTD